MRARDNPFRSGCLESLAFRLPEFNWAEFWDRFEQCERRGAIVGPEGSGKTTLLLECEQQLRTRNHRAVARLTITAPRAGGGPWGELRRCLAALPPGGVLLVDGADQISRFYWWRFRYAIDSRVGLLITSHRPGRLPTLVRCRTTAALLGDLIAELTGGNWGVAEGDLESLYARHQGNLREALRELYDRWGMEPVLPCSELGSTDRGSSPEG